MRTFFFILITTGFLVGSCKKESSDPQPATIARMWQPQSIAITAVASNQSLTIYNRQSNAKNLVDYSTYRMNLGAGSVLTIYNNGVTDTGTWQFNNDQLSLNYGCCDKEVFTVGTVTTTDLNMYYTISPTTQNTREQTVLTGAKSSYGFDTSKGVKLIALYTPL